MAAHLSYGRVNLNILREAARKELREFLDKCAGSKVMKTHKHGKHGGHSKHTHDSDSEASLIELSVVATSLKIHASHVKR